MTPIMAGLGIFLDLFFINFFSDLIILFSMGFWLLVIYSYRLPSKISLGGGLVFLAFCPFFLIFGEELIAGKLAVWAYAFLLVGTSQVFLGYSRWQKKH